MASQAGFSIQCSFPNGHEIPKSEVDAWELKAARRSLLNLKSLLKEQVMLDLLAEQIKEGDAYFKTLIAQSNGKFKEARVDISAKGIKASQFLQWFKNVDNKDTPEQAQQFFTEVMAPAHPEHYALGPYPIGIVETIGEHICRVRVDNKLEIPQWVKDYGDSSFPIKFPVTGLLDDDTIFFYGYQEARETEDGCDFRFRIIFPAASPQVLFDEHTEHLAIEFRHWIAAASKGDK